MKKLTLMVFTSIVCSGFPALASAHAASIGNQAWEVCESRAKSDYCEYSDDHDNRYRGTCQLMSEHLLCVRNQPIEKADKV